AAASVGVFGSCVASGVCARAALPAVAIASSSGMMAARIEGKRGTGGSVQHNGRHLILGRGFLRLFAAELGRLREDWGGAVDLRCVPSARTDRGGVRRSFRPVALR